MKKSLLMAILSVCILAVTQSAGAITDLWQVYQQAQQSDPTFLQAYAQEMSTAEAVPENRAALLPQLSFDGSLGWSKTESIDRDTTISATTSDYTTRKRTTNYDLDLTQSIFNLANWEKLFSARNTVKAASATYNAAAQSLMQRVVTAYFAVLQAQDVLEFTTAKKAAVYQEYLRAKEGFSVGLNTITDVYNAKAAYDDAVASEVTAKNDVDNKREDLRAITGVLYKDLKPLEDHYPLSSPKPNDIEQWVTTAGQQNWGLVAARYTVLAAHDTILAARSGHLPTLDLAANYGRDYSRILNSGGGYTVSKGPSAELDLKLPLYQGGSVNSATRKAKADYEVSVNQRDKTGRDVETNTRKDYLSIMSDISKINADYQAIVSNKSSLDATKEGYQVGTRTIIDVLNAEQDVYNAQTTWAKDRYDYIVKSIELKLNAGTLSASDLQDVNTWLIVPAKPKPVTKSKTIKAQTQKKSTSKSAKPAITKAKMPKKNTVKSAQPKATQAKTTPTIKTKKVDSTKVTASSSAAKTYYYLQVGAYSDVNLAKQMVGKVNAVSNAICQIYPDTSGGKKIYRVQVGPLSTEQLANTINNDLQKAGLPPSWIIKKPAH